MEPNPETKVEIPVAQETSIPVPVIEFVISRITFEKVMMYKRALDRALAVYDAHNKPIEEYLRLMAYADGLDVATSVLIEFCSSLNEFGHNVEPKLWREYSSQEESKPENQTTNSLI